MNRRLIIVTLFLCAAPVAAQSVTPFVPGMVVTQTTRITPGFYEVPGRRSLDDALIVDEWGPYDGRSPKLWPLDTVSAPVDLRVLGPPGALAGRGRRRSRRLVRGLWLGGPCHPRGVD